MPVPVAAIVGGIATAASLAESIGSMSSAIPSPPAELSDKHRSVSVTIFNQTQYELHYEGAYFDSGRFWTAPTNIAPFSELTFSGCDKDGSVGTGVSGGAVFHIQADLNIPEAEKEGLEILEEEFHTGLLSDLDLAIGFTNPGVGGYKLSGVFGGDGESAYEAATTDTSGSTSQTFSGNDTNDSPIMINFHVVSSPGTEASITLTEQIAA